MTTLTLIEQIIRMAESFMDNAELNGWYVASRPNINKWADSKIQGLKFPVEEWDWQEDLRNFLLYVWCSYGPTRNLIVISSADWCGGRQNELFLLEEDPVLQDFDYIEWRGSTRNLLNSSNKKLINTWQPPYENEVREETTPQQLFFKKIFEEGVGLRTI